MNKTHIKSIYSIILMILTVFILLSSSTLSLFQNLKINENCSNPNKLIAKNNVYTQNGDQIPEWQIGDYWIYRINFDGYYTHDKLGRVIELKESVINNFKIEVININDNNYIVDLSGSLTSRLSLMGVSLDFGNFEATIEGTGSISKSGLVLNNFYMKASGEYKLFGAIPCVFGYLELDVDFSEKPLDFLDLPISENEDVDNPWGIDCTGEADGYAGFWIPISHNFVGGWNLEAAGSLNADSYYVIEKSQHTVGAGTFNSYKIQGCIAPQHGGKSYIWYSPEAGFVVEIQEEFYDFVGMSGEYKMKLRETNYEPPNTPPYKPSNPSPSDDSTNQEINIDLNWQGGDPDEGDAVEYDVYFGTNPNPSFLEKTSNTKYNLGMLNYEETYYWKIVSRDNRGESTEGETWSFTTREEYPGNEPPFKPSNPFPSNGDSDCFIVVKLRWDGGDPNDDVVKYEVYLGTNRDLDENDLIIKNTEYQSWYSGILSLDTTYYWKVIATDDKGETTEGNIWTFKTIEELPQNDIPEKPVISGPTQIEARTKNTYYVVSEDDERDKIIYLVMSFLNGQPSSEPIFVAGNSGERVSFTFKPSLSGDYVLKARATDNPEPDFERWSDWGILEVTSSKNKLKQKTFLENYLNFINQFSFFKKIIHSIFQNSII